MDDSPRATSDGAGFATPVVVRAVDEDVEGAWSEEIRRRLADFDAGNSSAIPWSRARRRIRSAASGRGRDR